MLSPNKKSLESYTNIQVLAPVNQLKCDFLLNPNDIQPINEGIIINSDASLVESTSRPNSEENTRNDSTVFSYGFEPFTPKVNYIYEDKEEEMKIIEEFIAEQMEQFELHTETKYTRSVKKNSDNETKSVYHESPLNLTETNVNDIIKEEDIDEYKSSKPENFAEVNLTEKVSASQKVLNSASCYNLRKKIPPLMSEEGLVLRNRTLNLGSLSKVGKNSTVNNKKSLKLKKKRKNIQPRKKKWNLRDKNSSLVDVKYQNKPRYSTYLSNSLAIKKETVSEKSRTLNTYEGNFARGAYNLRKLPHSGNFSNRFQCLSCCRNVMEIKSLNLKQNCQRKFSGAKSNDALVNNMLLCPTRTRSHSHKENNKTKFSEFRAAVKAVSSIPFCYMLNLKYFCDLCSYSTEQKPMMLVHSRRHTGEKPYKCKFCSYATVDRSHLIRHTMVHTGQKPHKCLFCGYSCIQKYSLRLHSCKRRK